MRKSIARKLALLLALILLTTTFGSDYNSIGVRASEAEDFEEQDVSTDTLSSDYSDADFWEPQDEEVTEEPAEEVEEPAEEIQEEPEEEPQEEVVEEPSEETPSEDIAPVDETPAEETPSDEEAPAEEVPAEETPSEDEAPVEETPAEEAPAEEAPVEETVIEEKIVTVTYAAEKGGKVSNKKESINVNDETAAFEGSTATAINDEYTFVGWVDGNGNPVCSEATFIPEGIEEDSSFTAQFVAAEDISERMPAIEEIDYKTGGMLVSVTAEEGIFPAGTKINIEAIDDNDALQTAKDTLGEKVNQAKGVDITFTLNDEEIQPADNKYVHVSIALDEATVEGDSFTVLHDHDGEVEEIKKATIDTEDANVNPNDVTQAVTNVEFDVNQFSIFIVVGEGEDNPDENEYEISFSLKDEKLLISAKNKSRCSSYRR